MLPLRRSYDDTSTSEAVFRASFVYIAFAAVFVSPPRAVRDLGLTVQGLMGRRLGREHRHFVAFHAKRAAYTIISHAMLVIGYIAMVMGYVGSEEALRALWEGRVVAVLGAAALTAAAVAALT